MTMIRKQLLCSEYMKEKPMLIRFHKQTPSLCMWSCITHCTLTPRLYYSLSTL